MKGDNPAAERVIVSKIIVPAHIAQVWEAWTGFGTAVRVPSYRRPLSAVINPLVGVGSFLERILEPTPTEEFRQKDPKDYQ